MSFFLRFGCLVFLRFGCLVFLPFGCLLSSRVKVDCRFFSSCLIIVLMTFLSSATALNDTVLIMKVLQKQQGSSKLIERESVNGLRNTMN